MVLHYIVKCFYEKGGRLLKKDWVHRLQLFKRRLRRQGTFLSLIFYYKRLCQIVFVRVVFGRSDIRIYPDAQLSGVKFMKIGNNFSAGRGLRLEAVKDYIPAKQIFTPQLIIGNHVSIGDYVHIGCNYRVVIGDDVLMGSKIYITDHNHGVYRDNFQDSPYVPPAERKLTEDDSVRIGSRCWIGEFAVILPGVTIGDGAIIGSHSTVTHDIPANSIAVGSPAHVVKQWDEKKQLWLKI